MPRAAPFSLPKHYTERSYAMNIQEAKQIPLQVVVERLGGRYSHTDRRGDFWFFSPFRPEEKTASFKVNAKYNTWHDFGLASTFAHKMQGSGGDILDLWSDYHFRERRSGTKQTLQELASFSTTGSQIEMPKRHQRKEKLTEQNLAPRYKILSQSAKFTHPGLLDELGRRRITKQLATVYLKQGHILDTVSGRRYYGFLFENDKGGYEVSVPNPHRNECFKTCIGPKASTRIMSGDDIDAADVFEGFWDFLSWLHMKAVLQPINHSYILNSTSLVGEVCDKLIAFKETVKHVFLFMDNDDAGFQATHAIASNLESSDFALGSMEQVYSGYKDISAFWSI